MSTAFQHSSILKSFFLYFVSQICPLRSICLHSGGWKAGLNGPRFVRTIDVLSDAKKVFFCKFGIDFAFYNLAGCLAWRGSWLCPSLNIFGLKTGRGGAWAGGRIPIGFISLQHVSQGGCALGAGQTFTIILRDKASTALKHSKIFSQDSLLDEGCYKSLTDSYCIAQEFLCIPGICRPAPSAPPSPPEGPHNARCWSFQTTSGARSPKVIPWGPNLSWPARQRA